MPSTVERSSTVGPRPRTRRLNSDQARHDLSSVVIRERLAAARIMARTATADDKPLLRECLRNERVQWVRDALRAALSRIELVAENDSSDGTYVELASEVNARATVEVTGQLLHELEPLVGLLRARLIGEWTEFEGSNSERSLAQLEEFLDVMTDMHAAAQVPVLREVELRSLLNEEARELKATAAVQIDATGPELRVVTDPRLVRLVVRNGLKNALEAVDQATGTVVLTWGRAREGFFVSVVDNGVGVSKEFSLARLPSGTTTKQGHLGMGLSLVRQAAESLGATVDLSPRGSGGSRLELRCPDGA